MNILPATSKLKSSEPSVKASASAPSAASPAPTARRSRALALASARGCAELHDRMMVGLHVHRIECDELWAYVGHKRNPQAGPKRHPSPVLGDQYTYVALASSTRAIIGYRTGKRDSDTTDEFIQDLRERVIGVPEISTDGLILPERDPRRVRQARHARRHQ